MTDRPELRDAAGLNAVAWRDADSELRRRFDRLDGGDSDSATIVAESARRRLILLRSSPVREMAGEQPLLIKHYRVGPRRRLSARVKAWLGSSGADREWAALRELHARGLSVPEPLGLGSLPRGERVLVMEFVEGRPLEDALRAEAHDLSAILESLGREVARVHAAGTTHRDLHAGNVLLTEKGPALLDFQSARRGSAQRDRVRDVASLDFSLASHGVSPRKRARFRAVALGVTDSDTSGRRALHEVERASRAFARDHYRGRTRRCLRPGRRFRRVELEGYSGMRVADLAEEELVAALDRHRHAVSRGGPAVLKCDHRARVSRVRTASRSVVVKEVTKGGAVKRLADRFRGSPARRAWIGGHGLRVRALGAAEPLAWLERQGGIGPSESLVVLEDLDPARPVAAYLRSGEEAEAAEAVAALYELVVALHDRGVVHGDLQAHHVYLRREAERLRPLLLDLEGVRFPRRLSDARRVQALVELNASLPDALVGARERRRLFQRYAAALPFREGLDHTLERVVRESRRRDHFWTGEGCDEASARSRIRSVSR